MKNGASFAELFIILALLYLIQFVVTVGYAGKVDFVEAASFPEFRVVTIRQVSRSEKYVDHIRSLQIGHQLLTFTPGGCGLEAGSTFLPSEADFTTNGAGDCRTFNAEFGLEQRASSVDARKRFIDYAKSKGVTVSLANAPGEVRKNAKWPQEITLSFDPEAISEPVPITVSHCLCLEARAEGETPHPLQIEISRFGEKTDINTIEDNFHTSNASISSQIDRGIGLVRQNLHLENTCPAISRSQVIRTVSFTLYGDPNG